VRRVRLGHRVLPLVPGAGRVCDAASTFFFAMAYFLVMAYFFQPLGYFFRWAFSWQPPPGSEHKGSRFSGACRLALPSR
jgi:hypothetical protein